MREKSAARRLRRTGAVLLAALVATILPAAVAHAASNIRVEKSDSADPVFTGQILTYTIQVENQGADPADAVEVSDRLPAGLDFISVQTTEGNCDRQGRLITCQLGTLNPDETDTITIRTRVTRKRAGTLENTAEGTTTTGGDPAANNTDTERTTVRVPPSAPRCQGFRATIVGNNGNNTIIGTPGTDVILAGGGDDSVFAGGGRDIVCLGAGFDLGVGGPKSDSISGGLNGDRIRGKGGSDRLLGKRGPDRLRGGRGPDFLAGGRGFDLCRGGPGADILRSCNP